MGCNVSKTGIAGITFQRAGNTRKNSNLKPTSIASKEGDVIQVRKMSLPGETSHQRRRLSVAQIDGTGVVDENADR